MDEFQVSICNQAQHLVDEVFPQKVMELDAYLHSDIMQQNPENLVSDKFKIEVPDGDTPEGGDQRDRKETLEIIYKEKLTGAKPHRIPIALPKAGNAVPLNDKLTKLISEIQPRVHELIGHVNTVKLWLQFLTPKMEDRNNFGVEVQEEAYMQAQRVENHATELLSEVGLQYYNSRAGYIQEVMENPFVSDYRQAVDELDKIQYVRLRCACMHLRAMYYTLLDLISKNMDKIVRPKASHTQGMY